MNENLENEEMVIINKVYENAQALKEKGQGHTFLYLLPDPENEFIKAFEIEDPSSYEIIEKWTNIIANAYVEYYRNSDIYDNAEQEIGPIELVLNAIKTNNIPLIKYWKAAKIEVLNTIWLNQQI